MTIKMKRRFIRLKNAGTDCTIFDISKKQTNTPLIGLLKKDCAAVRDIERHARSWITLAAILSIQFYLQPEHE